MEIGCGEMGVGQKQAMPRVLVLATSWVVGALTEMRSTRRKQTGDRR